MIKKFINNHSSFLLNLCILVIITKQHKCHIFLHDNTPPTGLDQWLAKKVKSKYHD